eukprot:PhF_6_TR31111/c1_g1_i4/m.45521
MTNSILGRLHLRYLAPQFSFNQKSRNVVVLVMCLIWMVFTIDTIIGIVVNGLTINFLKYKHGSTFVALFLPYGLIRSYNKVNVSDGVLTYLLQCLSVMNSFAALKSAPGRPNAQQAVLLLFLFAMLNIPHWKLHSITAVIGWLIVAYNVTFGANGYPM